MKSNALDVKGAIVPDASATPGAQWEAHGTHSMRVAPSSPILGSVDSSGTPRLCSAGPS